MSNGALAEREQTDVDYRVAVAYTVPVEVIIDLREGRVARAMRSPRVGGPRRLKRLPAEAGLL